MISMDKQYRTRDGREVRIYAVDANRKYPVHGAVKNDDGWRIEEWSGEGRDDRTAIHNSPGDLIEVRPKITRTYWLVHGKIYDPTMFFQYEGGADAERRARDYARATLNIVAITGPHTIEFAEGDGL